MARVAEFGVGFETVAARDQIAAARLAEEMGFGTFWVPEDYFFRGAFTLASAIACSTSRMRVGLGVVNPYTRHPVLTAMETAALAEIATDRVILGIGASVRFWIEKQMGVPYRKPATAMRETVEIVRRLLRGEAVSYQGAVFRTDGAKLSFAAPRHTVPIHLGVIGRQNLEMAGAIADGVLLSAMTSPAYARFAVERIRDGAKRAGRSPDDVEIGAMLFVSISEDARQAREAVKPFLATLVSLISGQPESPLFTAPGMAAVEVRGFGERFAAGTLPTDLVTDWMIDTYAIAGSPRHCRAALGRIVDAGVRHPVAFEIPGVAPEQTITAVHRHLMPHFL
jgi:5,10-methylenetetrahydromethanopterin reductase